MGMQWANKKGCGTKKTVLFVLAALGVLCIPLGSLVVAENSLVAWDRFARAVEVWPTERAKFKGLKGNVTTWDKNGAPVLAQLQGRTVGGERYGQDHLPQWESYVYETVFELDKIELPSELNFEWLVEDSTSNFGWPASNVPIVKRFEDSNKYTCTICPSQGSCKEGDCTEKTCYEKHGYNATTFSNGVCKWQGAISRLCAALSLEQGSWHVKDDHIGCYYPWKDPANYTVMATLWVGDVVPEIRSMADPQIVLQDVTKGTNVLKNPHAANGVGVFVIIFGVLALIGGGGTLLYMWWEERRMEQGTSVSSQLAHPSPSAGEQASSAPTGDMQSFGTENDRLVSQGPSHYDTL